MVKEIFPGSDTPGEAVPSSVGALVWPPIEANEGRKKGLFRFVIDSTELLIRITDRFNRLPFDNNISRNTARIFVNLEILKERGQSIDPLVEGIIPLQGCGINQLDDVALVYLGINSPERTPNQDSLDNEIRNAESIFNQTNPLTNNHNHDRFEFFFIDQHMRQDSELQRQFFDLYSVFGWKEEDVIMMLSNPNNILMGVFKDGLLVSTGMAERAQIILKRNGHKIPFVFNEVTEAATREQFRGNGLYTSVAIRLNQYLANTDTNLVYAESNLLAPGVLKAARRQGRHSVLETFNRFGISPKPLRQHVRISGGINDVRPDTLKNDLLVTYLVQEELKAIYGR